MSNPEIGFRAAMIGLYEQARELGYNATRFRQLIDERGAVSAARKLISDPGPAEGFTKLWEMRRLDLSVEALVQRPEFHEIFSPAERRAARERLQQYGWSGT